jgi:hypothetical protein
VVAALGSSRMNIRISQRTLSFPEMPSISFRTFGRPSHCNGSHLFFALMASCGSATSCSTSIQPALTSALTHGSPAQCRTRRWGGLRASWPSTSVGSSAPTAGSWRQCSSGPASRSSTATSNDRRTPPTRAAAEGTMREKGQAKRPDVVMCRCVAAAGRPLTPVLIRRHYM